MKWTMHVPVLSTAHAPSLGSLVNLCDKSLSAVDYGLDIIFVYLDADESWDEEWEQWVAPIAAFLREHYPGESWIRFDPDGDIVPELPTYEW